MYDNWPMAACYFVRKLLCEFKETLSYWTPSTVDNTAMLNAILLDAVDSEEKVAASTERVTDA